QDAEGNKTYHIELRQKKNNAWNVVYSGSGDAQNVVSTARFVQAGRGEKYLTWYENGGLYQMANDSFKPVRLTPADLEIPTSDYRLFGSFAKSNIALIGTASKDSSENAFAIVSNDAGKSWRKASVTDIDENALVNEIGIAYTRSEEPIVFYSVQNYGVNTDMSYVSQDAETLLDSPDRAQAGGLAGGFLLGKDDPRFTDTSTDLYMKARRATRKVEIADITFDDIEEAQRGEPSPMTVTVENTGLYRLDNVTLYAGDEKLGDFPVNLKGGETTQLKASVVVPEDAGNDPIDYVIKASSRKGIIDHEMTGTMDIGHIAIRFRHQLEGGTESIAYRVSHTGFLPQKVVFYLFDEDTGKKFYSSPMTIKPKYTLESELAFVSDLFTRMGHNNVRAYIVTEEESRSVQGDISLEQFEKTLNPDSSRSFHIEALKEIYLQDVSKAYKVSSHSIAAAPESESVSGSRNGNGENYHTLILILIGAAFVILSGAAIYLRVRNKKDGQDGEKEDL
ncbi:MAG: hypothetical protein II627_01825, partial [Lachnospiraceae bacterium]|nr:hypothetical protein [Lachnospiraceae bacterium]